MISICLVLMLILSFLFARVILGIKIKELFTSNFSIAFVLCMIVTLVLSVLAKTNVDTMVLKIEAISKFENTMFSNLHLYENTNDYSPFYMAVLFVFSRIVKFFNLDLYSFDMNLLIKLPSIFANSLMGIFIFSIAKDRFSDKSACLLMCFYILNPVVLLNSSLIGYYNSIGILFICMSLNYLNEHKIYKSFFLYALALSAMKECIIFLPIIVGYSIFLLNKPKNDLDLSIRRTGKHISFINIIFSSLIALSVLYLILYPFIKNKIDLYTIVKYLNIFKFSPAQSGSQNAYNLYSILGYLGKPAYSILFYFDIHIYSLIFYAISIFISLLLLFAIKGKHALFVISTFVSYLVFLTTSNKSESFGLLPLTLLLICFIYSNNKKYLTATYILMTTLFLNYIDIFIMKLNEIALRLDKAEFTSYQTIKYSYGFLSFLQLIGIVFFIYIIWLEMFKGSQINNNPFDFMNKMFTNKSKTKMFIPNEQKRLEQKFCKKDYLFVFSITIIYAIIAFSNLGDMTSPKTIYSFNTKETLNLELDNTYDSPSIIAFLGPETDKKFTVSTSLDSITWTEPIAREWKGVFKWLTVDLTGSVKYIRITSKSDNFKLFEMGFLNKNKEIINLDNYLMYENLFDEPDFVPNKKTFMNSSYFDEVYHGRTAYEFQNKLKVYEWTHPPMGKNIILVGLEIFGFNPFGWRVMGTLCGVLMLPLLYLFAKKLFRKPLWALFATTCFAFDFMHYAQTRIGTIDSYTVFFIMGMYYFMYQYINSTFYYDKLSKTLKYLFLSGLFMAFAISTKWQGVYAAVGLAFIFFASLFIRYKEFKLIRYKEVTRNFYSNCFITLFSCLLFFIIIPVIIYVASYIPYYLTGNLKVPDEFLFIANNKYLNFGSPVNLGKLIAATINEQKRIFTYHSELVSTHPFSSNWYTWIFNMRPIFYYSNTFGEGIKAGISSFGNPAIWWMGIVAIINNIKLIYNKRDKNAIFLLTAYLAQMIFWIPVSRTTYIYHYFPAIPFLILLITNMFINYTKHKKKTSAFIYIIIVIILFVLFYPVITGIPIYKVYVDYLLKWIPSSWQFY